MKTKAFYLLASGALFLGLVFTSCDKSDIPDTTAVENETLVENLFDDIFSTVNDAELKVDDYIYTANMKKSALTDSCPVITVDKPDSVNWPKTITIDFGEGCTGFNDRIRTGKIIVVVTGRYRIPGSSKTVTLEDYTINGIAVEGTKTVVNDGRNEANHLVFTATLTGGKVTLPDGEFTTREYTRTREWVFGEETINPWDDIYLISGEVSGVNFDGEEYLHTILTPLEKDMACRFIKSGTIQFERGDRPAFVIDYGYGDPEGGCDALALVTQDGGESKVITLRFHHPRFLR